MKPSRPFELAAIAAVLALAIAPSALGDIFSDSFENPPNTAGSAPVDWTVVYNTPIVIDGSETYPGQIRSGQQALELDARNSTVSLQDKAKRVYEIDYSNPSPVGRGINVVASSWWYTGTKNANGTLSGLQGMGMTMNMGGTSFKANYMCIGGAGGAGLPVTGEFYWKVRYGVNWPNNKWINTGLLVPEATWVQFVQKMWWVGGSDVASQARGRMEIWWLDELGVNQLRWTSGDVVWDGTIAGTYLKDVQLGAMSNGSSAYALSYVDDVEISWNIAPEPSGLVAIFVGLTAAAGILRRRR